ncbi:MAG: hypothetical protein K8R21_00245 [Leptospira sp.]|nr:hypothetical protein [Leptospira sp.]
MFSYEKIISLNSKRLKVNLDIDPDDFTPDGDGDDDLLEIFVNVRNSSVNVWELTLYETGLSGSSPRRKIKVWKGDRNPAERIVWDGHGDDTLPIGSLAKLELEFTYEDEMKNIGTKRFNNFQTGVLVTDSDGTLHIAIPEILVKESESSIIRKIRSLLKLYPGYKMEVQSHSAQAGKDLENLSKTEARAKRLFKLIFGKEFPEEKYRYRGYGEVEPQLNLQNEYSEEKNNRIEVVFKK